MPKLPLDLYRSFRGSQYTSVEFGSRLREEGLLPSMGSVADAYDNSMAESFISTLKRELVHRHSWLNRQMVRTAIFEYVHRRLLQHQEEEAFRTGASQPLRVRRG